MHFPMGYFAVNALAYLFVAFWVWDLLWPIRLGDLTTGERFFASAYWLLGTFGLWVVIGMIMDGR